MKAASANMQDHPREGVDPGAVVSRTEAGSANRENQQLGNHRTVSAMCQTHGGCKGFCNLRLTKVGGEITLDPHVTGCCVIRLDETEAGAVRDTLTEWLG